MKRLLPAFLLAFGVGCANDEPNDDTSVNVVPGDADGDGFRGDVDCDDDENTAVHPNADEVCNGIDDDCDSEVDEGLGVTWYQDLDGDGWGNDAVTVFTCDAPVGFVDKGGDCDDQNAASWPTNEEICDGFDNDCDTSIDEDLDSAWFPDADEDGYGSAEGMQTSCSQPKGYVPNATDCDDANAIVNPGADEICDGLDNDCDGSTDEYGAVDAGTWYIDYDHDGFGATAYTVVECEMPTGFADNADDCDDTDATSFPGGIEVCDDADNDCNDLIDDAVADSPAWFEDADSDGFGNALSSVVACEAPPGWVADSTDCDDTAAAINPDAIEVCDGLDNNCNSLVDDDPVDALVWYPDDDTDGYGRTAEALTICSFPDGYSLSPGDCDDTDAAINPAATEVCDNADNDCDGMTDEADSTDALTWYLDDDGNLYGDATRTMLSCSQPADYVADATDCDDTNPDINPGAEEICNDETDDDCDSLDLPCNLYLDDAPVVWMGEAAADRAGYDLASIGDFNGDGWPDVATGALYNDGNGTDAGAAYVVTGPFTASGPQNLASATLVLRGEATGDLSGFRVGGGGDVTGDGLDDLFVGSYYESSYRGYAGAAYLVSGPLTGTTTLAVAVAKRTGDNAWDHAGCAGTIPGDLDGDGVEDLVFGAYNDSHSALSSGSAYVLYGPVTGSGTTTAIADRIDGDAEFDALGGNLAPAGDVNGDGFADLLVGVTANDAGGSEAGIVYVIPGPINGTARASDVALAVITGRSASDDLGMALSTIGDANGDGFDDFVLGSRNDDVGGANAGAVYLFYGPASNGTVDGADLGVFGDEASAGFGVSVDGAFDYDGDGVNDLFIGASSAGDAGEGQALIFLGPIDSDLQSSDFDAAFTGTDPGDSTGFRVVGMESARTDGGSALAISASTNNDNGADAGAFYLAFDVGM